MKRASLLVLLLTLILPVAAVAHGKKGPHGGQMLLVGNHRYEMVVKESTFEILVMSLKKSQSVDLKGVTGSATIHSNGDKRTDEVALAVNGDHLEGHANLAKLGEAEVHVKIKIEGKEATMAFEYPPD